MSAPRPDRRTPGAGAVLSAAELARLRADVPILARTMRGRRLAYLDNAATTQKPRAVIDALARFYAEDNSNVHRGAYELAERATAAYEGARDRVRRFLNARDAREIVFTRGTTESINLVATSFGRSRLHEGDEILITHMEHHSNIVPWQLVCEERGARLRVTPISDAGELDLDELERRIGPRTRLVAVVHVSNVLGTVNPIPEIVALAHRHDVPVLVDGAQAPARLPVDVQRLGCDFYAFSGHKLYGPTGIGVLYARAELLEAMPPYQGGGQMIAAVSFEKTTFADPPARFEAGTPNVAGAVGLAAAMDWLEAIGVARAGAHEDGLLDYATERVEAVPGVRRIGSPKQRAGALSFVMAGVHPHDVATVLDHEGVAVRAGHHCAQPLMARYSVPATVRASLGVYNTREDVDALVDGLARVIEVFG